MTDLDIKKYQTKPARVDVIILTEENVEEFAKLIGSVRYSVSTSVATGEKKAHFEFDNDPRVRYDFGANFGSALVYEYENEDPRWDWAPVGLLDQLDPYEENPAEYNFSPPYDN